MPVRTLADLGTEVAGAAAVETAVFEGADADPLTSA
jgi:hypothetical protein